MQASEPPETWISSLRQLLRVSPLDHQREHASDPARSTDQADREGHLIQHQQTNVSDDVFAVYPASGQVVPLLLSGDDDLGSSKFVQTVGSQVSVAFLLDSL